MGSALWNVMGLGGVGSDEDLEASIQSHIALLLNTRRGSLPHLPEYGLPDLSEIYTVQKNGLDDFTKIIEKTLSRFEPRLRTIKVKREGSEENTTVLRLLISGNIKQGSNVSRLAFRTEVHRDGRFNTSKVSNYG